MLSKLHRRLNFAEAGLKEGLREGEENTEEGVEVISASSSVKSGVCCGNAGTPPRTATLPR